MPPSRLRFRFAAAARCALLVGLIAPLAMAMAAEKPKTAAGWTVGGFGGHGFTILSSEVNRDVAGLNLGYGRPEPHFRIGSVPAQLVFEGYVFNTRSAGIDFSRPFAETVVGGLAISRWRWARSRGLGAYLDVGIGLSYADRRNRDLDSRVNSTPYLGGGFSVPSGGREWLLGLAWLHLSNAGTVGHNQGVNILMVTARFRF